MASATGRRRSSIGDVLRETERLVFAGNPAGALDTGVRAFRSRFGGAGTGGALSAAELMLVERMADLAAHLGQWDAADDLLATIALATAAVGNVEGADYAVLKRAHLLAQRGSAAQAMDLLETMAPRMGYFTDLDLSPAGLAAWERECGWNLLGRAVHDLLVSRAYPVMAALLLEFGQYVGAGHVLDRALARTGHVDGVVALARPLLELMRATAALEAGEPERAITLARGLDSEASPGQRLEALAIQGRAALINGRFGEAVEILDRTGLACERIGLVRAAAVARLDGCRVMISLNQTVRAEQALAALAGPITYLRDKGLAARHAALADLVRLRRTSVAAEIDLGLSVTAMQRRFRPAGIEVSPAVSDDAPRTGGFLSRFHAAALEVEKALALDDAGAAELALEGARLVAGRTDSRLILGHLQLLEGLVAVKVGRPKDAATALRECLPLLRASGAVPLLWQALRGLVRVLDDDEADASEEAAAEAEQLLARLTASLPLEEAAVYRLNKATAEEERQLTAVTALAEAKQRTLAQRGFRYWWGLRRLNRDLASFCFEIDRRRGRRLSWRRWWAAVRWQRRDVTTLMYLVFPDVVAIIVARRGRFDIGMIAATRLELQDGIRTWHRSMRNSFESGGSREAERPARDAAVALAALLKLPQIVDPGVQMLRIIPDSVLHAFPFAAAEWAETPLVARCATTLSTTFAPPPTARNRIASALIVASSGKEKYPALGEADQEIRDVGAILSASGAGHALLESNDGGATVSATLAALPRVDLAHFICHGQFVPDDPEASGLVLDDGLLSLDKISGLDLSALAHVTLSACSAADSYSLPGRTAVSVPERLIESGAGGVLAALWPIEDEVARLLMTRFYIMCQTFDRAEALRRVQLECREGLDGCAFDTRSAYFWSGFVLQGDGSRLRFR